MNTGCSRNADFEEYLNWHIAFATNLDNIKTYRSLTHLAQQHKWNGVKLYIKMSRDEYDRIHQKKGDFQRSFDISEEVLLAAPAKKAIKDQPSYPSTIPLSSHPLCVEFGVDVSPNEDGSFFVKGKTNLYDAAQLMLSLYSPDGRCIGQCKTFVEKEKFGIDALGVKDISCQAGEYTLKISLSIPATQDIKFVKKAGLEYENLSGAFIKRNGICTSGRYTYKFLVD